MLPFFWDPSIASYSNFMAYVESSSNQIVMEMNSVNFLENLSLYEPIYWNYFKNSVARDYERFDGLASIYFYDFNSERTISINPDEPFYPACLIKLPFLAACMQALYEGRISLDDNLTLNDADMVEGSGILHKDPVGSTYTIENLIRTMIMYSDNVALNILIDDVGMDYANACFTNFGLKNTILYHKVMYFGAITPEMLTNMGDENPKSAADAQTLWEELITNNYILSNGNITENFYLIGSPGQMNLDPQFNNLRTPLFRMMRGTYKAMGLNQMSASDAALILRKIYRGELINPQISKWCLSILEENLLNDRIPSGLPEGVLVAHKTGSTEHVVHDAGIIFTPKGDFILCVLTSGSKSGYVGGQKFIRKIALSAYNYEVGKAVPPYSFRSE